MSAVCIHQSGPSHVHKSQVDETRKEFLPPTKGKSNHNNDLVGLVKLKSKSLWSKHIVKKCYIAFGNL